MKSWEDDPREVEARVQRYGSTMHHADSEEYERIKPLHPDLRAVAADAGKTVTGRTSYDASFGEFITRTGTVPAPELPRTLTPEEILAREEGYRAPTTDAMPWAASMIAHLSTLDDDGRLVTVYDRVPAAGERGWYVASDDPIDEILADLLHNGPSMDGYYGWPAFGDETLTDRDVVSGSFRVVTVEEGSP